MKYTSYGATYLHSLSGDIILNFRHIYIVCVVEFHQNCPKIWTIWTKYLPATYLLDFGNVLLVDFIHEMKVVDYISIQINLNFNNETTYAKISNISLPKSVTQYRVH